MRTRRGKKNMPSDQVSSKANHIITGGTMVRRSLNNMKICIDIPPFVNSKFEENAFSLRLKNQV